MIASYLNEAELKLTLSLSNSDDFRVSPPLSACQCINVSIDVYRHLE